MLTIIGLLPTAFALNLDMSQAEITQLAKQMPKATPFIAQYGDDQKALGVDAANELSSRFAQVKSIEEIPDRERAAVRNDANRVISELRTASEAANINPVDKKEAKAIHDDAMKSVQYTPWWVRILSALCLAAGTMIGYQRIVKTLGERLGKKHLAPAQGAAAELVAALLIGGAGFSGFPVSTTHVVTGGISGTMVASGAGIQKAMLRQIAAAWVLTLPATIVLSGGLFYIFHH
jgi:PiT family inorganic phosphate transporter